jgi:membrane protein
MIVAVPTYSILKEIAKFLVRLYENHKEVKEVKNQLSE